MRAELAKCPSDLSGAPAGVSEQYPSDWEFFEQLKFVLDSILWGESTGNLTDYLQSTD